MEGRKGPEPIHPAIMPPLSMEADGRHFPFAFQCLSGPLVGRRPWSPGQENVKKLLSLVLFIFNVKGRGSGRRCQTILEISLPTKKKNTTEGNLTVTLSRTKGRARGCNRVCEQRKGSDQTHWVSAHSFSQMKTRSGGEPQGTCSFTMLGPGGPWASF